MPLDSIREGGASMLIREPGDLPDAVVLSCGRGVPNDRGFSSCSDGVGVCAGNHSKIKAAHRSEEHTSELQSLMRISYAVFCLKKKKTKTKSKLLKQLTTHDRRVNYTLVYRN